MEVDFEILEINAVLWSTPVIFLPLLVSVKFYFVSGYAFFFQLRIIISFSTTQCSNLNLNENIFVAICWIPKATVQVIA